MSLRVASLRDAIGRIFPIVGPAVARSESHRNATERSVRVILQLLSSCGHWKSFSFLSRNDRLASCSFSLCESLTRIRVRSRATKRRKVGHSCVKSKEKNIQSYTSLLFCYFVDLERIWVSRNLFVNLIYSNSEIVSDTRVSV